MYLRSLNIVEIGSLDNNPRVRFACNISDFSANVLAFSIAVRPYEQNVRIPSLSLDIPSYDFFVLRRRISIQKSQKSHKTYIVDCRLNRSIKQVRWVDLLPILVSLWEVFLDDVPDDAREGDARWAPWRAKRIIKNIVL
jgi:hypothetical protein